MKTASWSVLFSSTSTTSDIDGYVRDAAKRIAERVKFPAGYHIEWAGQFQYHQASRAAVEDRRSADAADHFRAASISTRDRS